MVLTAYLAAAGGGAWAAAREREVTKNVLLSMAALVFAAAIGLTGQIFDIAGDPANALRAAGVAAALLALAGRASWAAAAALVFVALGDAYRLMNGVYGLGVWTPLGWTLVAAPIGVAMALRWRSTPLAHVAGFVALWIVPAIPQPIDARNQALCLAASIGFAILAAGARHLRGRFAAQASTLYGWFIIGLLVYLALSAVGTYRLHVFHPLAVLILSAGVVTLGRHDRHASVTAVGVLGLLGAGGWLLFDLGVGLLTAAGIFAGCATAALVVAVLMRRRSAA